MILTASSHIVVDRGAESPIQPLLQVGGAGIYRSQRPCLLLSEPLSHLQSGNQPVSCRRRHISRLLVALSLIANVAQTRSPSRQRSYQRSARRIPRSVRQCARRRRYRPRFPPRTKPCESLCNASRAQQSSWAHPRETSNLGPMADRPLPGRPTRKADISAPAAEVWNWSRLNRRRGRRATGEVSDLSQKDVGFSVATVQNVLKSVKAD